MSTIIRTREGTWRSQVRRKGKYASQTFRLKTQASEWAIETERLIDLGYEPSSRRVGKPLTFTNLIDLHIADLQEVGKPLRRSKRAVLEALKRDVGSTRISNLDRFALIKYGKKRAKQGAGPVTLSVDLSYIRTILTHAAAVHGISVDAEDVRLARTALTRLGLIGRSNERDRRPSDDARSHRTRRGWDTRRAIARTSHHSAKGDLSTVASVELSALPAAINAPQACR